RFVGHPLADAFALEPDQAAARSELGLPPNVPVLALLPGSRLGEIHRLGGDFLQAAAILKRELPDLRIVAPMANAQCRAAFSRLGLQPDGLGIIDGNAHTAMIAADAVLLASGTAALEAMLAKRPMTVAYRIAPLTHFIVKTLGMLRTDVYSLPNILAGKRLVPELMQDACKPDALAAALLPFLRVRAAPAQLLAEFRRLHESLRGGGSAAAADAIAQLCAASADTHIHPL
ncbi:MAG: lipid-A-disaccharide synthase, partial [Rudaea sp.]